MMARSTGNIVIFAAFGTLCLMFAAIALTPWMIDPLDYLGHSDPATAPVEQSQPRGLPTLDAPAIESFAEIVDRPLFTATRRAAPQSEPTPPATVADAPDESLILGRYKLTGIVVTPAMRMVFVTVPGSRKTIAVARGKELDGWIITEVDRHVIVLESGDRRTRIKVGDDAEIEIFSE